MNTTDFLLRAIYGPSTSQLTSPQTRIDYDASQNAIYIGIAPKGYASSAQAWVIAQLTYDVNNNVTLIQHSPELSIWDNRAALVYA